jgi:hypothetical protein
VYSQDLFNTITGVVLAGLGWFARQLWDAVKELRGDLHRIESDLPKSYVMKVDLDQRMQHIEQMFQRIYDKLEAKADK